MMANLSERDRRTVLLGGIGVLLIIIVVFAIMPLMDHWDRLNRELAEGRKQLQAIETGLEEQRAARTAREELAHKARIYSGPVLLNRQTAAMLHQVETLPGYRGLIVRRLEGLPLREETDFYRSSVSLQFSGSLRDVYQFMRAVEKAQPSLRVDRLTATTDPQNNSKIEGQMVISGFAVVAAEEDRPEKEKRG
jgi:Tfp pilus assembly protein PilO